MSANATQPERDRSPVEYYSALPYVLKWVPAGSMTHRLFLEWPTTWADSGIADYREGKKTGGCPSCGRPKRWALLISQQGMFN